MRVIKRFTEPRVIPLPETGFVRLWQFLGCKTRGIVPYIPEAKSTWWAGVKNGTRPPAIKLGPNTTVWRVEDIHKYIADGQWTKAKSTDNPEYRSISGDR